MKVKIDNNLYVHARNMCGIVELQYMEKRNNECPIKVLNGNQYLIKSTGEICDFDKTGTNRTNSYKSLYRTFKQLRYLINNNFLGCKNELFVTLTYGGIDRPRILDGGKRFYMDFQIYIKALRRKYGHIEFINVVEPHADGHIHAHVLMKFIDYDSIFIANSELATIWGKGFVKVTNLKNVDNVGAYLSAYLTDVEVSDSVIHDCIKNGEKIVVKEINGKKFVKGARLKYYPKKFRIYRRSKGILDPEVISGVSRDIKKKIGILSREPDFTKKYEIKINDFSNTIIYEHFNLR